MAKKTTITRDTLILTAVSLILQGLSLLLNMFITKKLGTTAIGITSLIFSFYSFAIVFSNGNIFTSTSRFISEEIGKGCGNVSKVMSYALTFGITLSCIVAGVVFMLAPKFGIQYLKSEASVAAIRIMAMSLPLATIGSCIKGYFHAMRMVKKPCVADAAEFIMKFACMMILIQFFVPRHMELFTAIAVSMAFGEAASCIFLSLSYFRQRNLDNCECKASIPNIWRYIWSIMPIVLNGYIFAVLSSANDALVPLTLKQFGNSTETALGEFGVFEAFVMPIMFFPSVVLQNLSLILVPEIAREKSANNIIAVRALTEKVLKTCLSWAVLVASILCAYGNQIGSLFCDDPLAGRALVILCPVIPFIYLEIVLEGILKGLGMQNFSTVNSIAEYILRISAVLICIPVMGFNGIIVSYFVSNIICNIVRIFKVIKCTGLTFNFPELLIIPLFSALAAWEIGSLAVRLLAVPEGIICVGLYVCLTASVFLLIEWTLRRLTKMCSKKAF